MIALVGIWVVPKRDTFAGIWIFGQGVTVKDSDIASIKLGSAAFTKKWWEDNRSFFARGSGVGKALDLWQKTCKKKIDQMSPDELQTATGTCDTLRSALLTAKKKVGGKDKATTKACEAYLKVVDDFANDVSALLKKSGGLFAAEEEMADKLMSFLPLLKETSAKCRELERWFEEKSKLYAQYQKDAETKKMWASNDADKRIEDITAAELEVSEKMKMFGKWNNAIISPWKELKGRIATLQVDKAPKVRVSLREANGEYDFYVDALGKAQDLGQDHLDSLRRVLNVMKGKTETVEEVTKSLEKLAEQLSDPSFGAASKVYQQLETITELRGGLQPVLQAIKNKTNLSKDILEEAIDFKTKAKQIDAMAQANFRAVQRVKGNVEGYVKKYGTNKELKPLFGKLLEGIKKGQEYYDQQQKMLKEVLSILLLVEKQKQN